MTVIDHELAELHDQDPRLCKGPDPDEMAPPFEPFSGPHEWDLGPYCRRCRLSKDEVRDRFRDWRYEQIMLALNSTLADLASAIRRSTIR